MCEVTMFRIAGWANFPPLSWTLAILMNSQTLSLSSGQFPQASPWLYLPFLTFMSGTFYGIWMGILLGLFKGKQPVLPWSEGRGFESRPGTQFFSLSFFIKIAFKIQFWTCFVRKVTKFDAKLFFWNLGDLNHKQIEKSLPTQNSSTEPTQHYLKEYE